MNEQLKPFQQVLVRDNDTCTWACNYYSHYDAYDNLYVCVGGILFRQCIPYEGNEYLLGTTNSPKPKKWRAKKGEEYWYVGTACQVLCTLDIYRLNNADGERYIIGNYFRTKEEAEEMADRIKAVLKGE